MCWEPTIAAIQAVKEAPHRAPLPSYPLGVRSQLAMDDNDLWCTVTVSLIETG